MQKIYLAEIKITWFLAKKEKSSAILYVISSIIGRIIWKIDDFMGFFRHAPADQIILKNTG